MFKSPCQHTCPVEMDIPSYIALVREGRVTQGAAAGIRGDIARAYKAVEEPNAYRPADFRAALKSAAGAIGRLQ